MVITFTVYLVIKTFHIKGFGGSGTGSIGIIISSCSSYVWLLVFLFYLLVLLRVLQELETFNERLKEVCLLSGN